MADTCPRCGEFGELVEITHRNGNWVEVCEDCAGDARDGDSLFWRWFHKDGDAYVPDRRRDDEDDDG
jgi:hypothetical protein